MSLSFNGCGFPENKVSITFLLLYLTKTLKSCLYVKLVSVLSEFYAS